MRSSSIEQASGMCAHIEYQNLFLFNVYVDYVITSPSAIGQSGFLVLYHSTSTGDYLLRYHCKDKILQLRWTTLAIKGDWNINFTWYIVVGERERERERERAIEREQSLFTIYCSGQNKTRKEMISSYTWALVVGMTFASNAFVQQNNIHTITRYNNAEVKSSSTCSLEIWSFDNSYERDRSCTASALSEVLPKSKQIAAVVSSAALAAVLLFSPSIALAENELADKYGGKGFDSSLVDQTCLVDKCSLQAKACLGDDPSCRKGLTCTAKCMGDNSCITGCFARFGNKNLDNLIPSSLETFIIKVGHRSFWCPRFLSQFVTTTR